MGDRPAHLTDEQLVLLQDGEASRQEARHVETCVECAGRLRDLRNAVAAYVEYRESKREVIPAPSNPWRSLDELIADHRARQPGKTWYRWFVPAAAAALCLLLAAAVVVRRPGSDTSRAGDLLMRSAEAERPSNHMIRMRLHGRSVVRPALLVEEGAEESDREVARVHALFVEARYSWREPLSARSFQIWRNRLSDKRDSVSVIHAGDHQAYRVRTETGTGVLRSASLTLRENDLHAMNGAFQFAGEELVEIDEASTPGPAMSTSRSPIKDRVMETPATAAETLHVLAALNEIGADAGEPIEVLEDSGYGIVVRASGLSSDRRQQVTEALKAFPRVKLDLNAALGNVPASGARAPATETSAANIPADLRQRLETAFGGAVGMQEATDRLLEASGAIVSRTHAIGTLARKFPPTVESAFSGEDRALLNELRRRHIAELQRLVRQIRSDLQALLPAPNAPNAVRGSTWQSQADGLIRSAQLLDDSLNRLLAGSYSQPSGESMLHEVADEIQRLDWQVQFGGAK